MSRSLHYKRFSCPEGMNYCNRCDSYKPYAEFARDPDGPNGYTWYCKQCVSEYGKKYSDARVLRMKQRTYGIEPKEYLRLLENQGGVCAICGKPETKIYKGKLAFLSVDHNHQTGAVRGLLCSACNVGLGAFRDDLELLNKAFAYLCERDTGRTQNERNGIDQQALTKQLSDIEELSGAVHGLPKKLRGKTSDLENLPLFSIVPE
jgi:hypothetical protein